ncbi:hypothetical protein [Micromonospora sp. NPDC005979]|uniref:hypothetical protein n=1 Tax=Micromonospora sp. NPDC005979 TaxID=3156726 RepID=UPI0033B62D97
MTRCRPPTVRVGDVVEVDEQHYCYGLGRLILRVIEVGRRERHSDGIWLHLRGIELGPPGGPRQRRVLVRLAALQVRPARRTAEPESATPHVPVRPAWSCAGCGQEWPCANRRRRLLIEYAHDRLSLTFYLGLHLAEAAVDLPSLPAERLHARFLGWTRPRRS